ncbi:hypothetical protein [Mesorhizobium sp. M7A.F.Ca.MR.362.00.0.0]|uniref:hypothetical protein n=1 Tax=Mesorhizobium sp. M7A.F.Ca.MR.362.00.0.0 TaxID=2496779 RepID=UPI000FD4AC4A|nr:hypothetical protein [Mesorhizobium sp. M7A.F.Ca.MR.362.00.0.0]RUU76128.1 hypothetical protein EOC06_28130 [Mesorhizobium sp. M7A.F.Ca.MR.362.00.0.0]RWN95390.1 MAG: hypothetical protein EOS05_11395 [Mesorhizobium sp.]
MNMQDWKIAEEGADDTTDRRLWTVNVKTGLSRIDVDAKCPDGTNRALWVEINDGKLVVHAYDPDHDEPVNVRITKTGILVDSDDRGEKPLGYDTDRYERMEKFVEQMARMTTPEQEFDAKKGDDGTVNDDGVTYDDADEMVSDFSDDRLCDEYSAFMTMVRQAKELVA